MKVTIKSFDVGMEVKTKGIEFQVHDGTKHLGDIVLTKTGLIWCKGRTTSAKGIKVRFDEFANWAEQKTAKTKAGAKAAKKKGTALAKSSRVS